MLTKEEFEFYEDFIINNEIADRSEVGFDDGDLTVITVSGEVKLSPELKEIKQYLEARTKQKRSNYIAEKRKKTFHLV